MNKTIKLNGEFTKEELQEKLKEFDAPEWEIKKVKDYIVLFKNGKWKRSLLYVNGESAAVNLSTISRDMACAMDDLMETKDVLDRDKTGCYIFYNTNSHIWDWNTAFTHASDKHFKNEETAELAAELLNKSKDMKDWIKRMSE